jgi:predicted nucleotidyltransferase
MLSKLNKNILATIIYYDGLNYPLTVFEVWKYLIRTDYTSSKGEVSKISLSQIVKCFADNELIKHVEHMNGFCFLKGRSDLVSSRIAKNKISAGKIKKLKKIVWWLRFMPFVRMVGITGALAMKNAHPKSDLDVFIVIKNGKIWTGRTLVTVFLHILKKRRHGDKIVDRVCLNHYSNDQSLEVIVKDLFSTNEYMFLFPLYGFDVYTRFQMRNKWIRNMRPNYALDEMPPLKMFIDSKMAKGLRNFGEMIFSPVWIEKWLKKIEKKRIMDNPKTHQEGSLIYANDDALVFLPAPHGPLEFEKFKAKIEELKV